MTGWNLFREMESITREMDELFRGAGFGRMLEPAFVAGLGGRSYPRINVREEKENFTVQALLPGIDPQALEMTVLKNTLTLAGERKVEEAGQVTWHRRERSAERFLRTIDLPVEIDADRVKADYQDGVLTVTLPKAASAQPKRIEIEAA